MNGIVCEQLHPSSGPKLPRFFSSLSPFSPPYPLSILYPMSLPTRERGLKSGGAGVCLVILWSLPTRERGLKFSPTPPLYPLSYVAPHAGAWIEILCIQRVVLSHSVAPHAEAWIEISNVHLCLLRKYVAPHAGAWIEIYNDAQVTAKSMLSLPTRERGLKSSGTRSGCGWHWSLPTRERGLK